MMRRRLLLLSLTLFTWLSAIEIQAQDELALDRIRRSTVYIMQTQNLGGTPIVRCVGSGTIVNRSGLIVTNAHNTVTNEDCPGDELVIALSIRPDEPPVPTYYAEVAQADEGLDLALLRITRELTGRVVDTTVLNLPFVELGESSNVLLDDTITVVGYPTIQGDVVQDVQGTVRGFVAEPSGGERAWMKTDATIPGTMSGGGVYDRQGRLIGVPTTVPVTPLSSDITCIPLADTTGDNLINRNDICVPVGGFINAIRPSNFVRPLLRGASLRLSVEPLQANRFEFDTGTEPAFSRLLIASAVSEGMPTSIVQSLPTGTTSLYMFFDYANMTPNTIYELRVATDDIPNSTFSLAPVRWSGGANGLWYIGSSGQVWPDGNYEFTLLINGLASASTSLLIGGPAQIEPLFRNIVFGIEDGENIYGNAYVLPTGNIANARFVHQNVPDGMSWGERWYFDDTLIRESEEIWVNDGSGTKTLRISSDQGLPPGRYRLELYLDGALATTADFTIAGARQGAFPRVFSETKFVTAERPSEATSAIGTSSFSTGIRDIYGLFNWEQIAPGTLWTMRWSVDNVTFYEETVPWGNNESGSNFLVRLTGANGIPDGTYRMDLFVGQVLLGGFEAQVGIGQLPIDQFAQTVGIQLNGQIIDAETREGIPGVTFILISEDFSIEDFVWNQEQIYAMATTDRNGRFQLDRLLQFGAPYSVMIQAEGYLPVSADGIEVDSETENPKEISIPLTRDR